MKKTKDYIHILKITFSLAFMFIVIYYFLGKNPDSVIRDLKLVDYRFVILSFIFGGWAYVNRGLRWISLINALGYTSSKINSISAVSIGYLTNLFIPRAGEITRCTALSQVEQVPVDKLFGTILVERLIDFIMLILIMLTAALLNSREIILAFNKYNTIDFNKSTDIIVEDSSSTSFIVLGILIFIAILIYLFRNKIKKTAFYHKITQFLKGLKQGFKSIKNIRNKRYFWFHTISIWIMYFLMTYICFYCMEETSHLNLGDGLFLLFLGGIGMAIPTPGGVGSYHLMVMTGLVALAVPSGFITIKEYDAYNPALLFPIIIWFAQSLVAIIMGSSGMLILFLSKKKYNVKSQ